MQRSMLQHAFFLFLVLLVTVAFVWLIHDFLQPLFWAAVVSIIFYPVHQRMLSALGTHTSLAAGLTLLTIVLVVILPLFLVAMAMTREAAALYERIQSGDIDLVQPLRAIERTLPLVSEYAYRFGFDAQKLQQGLSDAAVAVSQFLASQAINIGQNALRLSVLFFLMLYLLFFFLRDGTHIVDTLVRILPLGDERERHLFGRFVEVSRATIKGTFVVGLVQGTLGGLLFWGLGLKAPLFWGVMMAIVSLLPALGSAIIWLPAAVWLFVAGDIVRGLILVGVGSFVIGLVDNVLRPILVRRDTLMPDYLILLATLGGLALFGLSGFIIGPIIAALFLAVWEMLSQQYNNEMPGGTMHEDRRETPTSTASLPPASHHTEALTEHH